MGRHLPTRNVGRKEGMAVTGKGSSLVAGANEKEGIQLQRRGRIYGLKERSPECLEL